MNFNYATLEPRIQIYDCTKDEENIYIDVFIGFGGVNGIIFGVILIILWYFTYFAGYAK
jgi:hypothetical protein